MHEQNNAVTTNSVDLAQMSVSELRNARTPFTMEVTLEKLKNYLCATDRDGATELLNKAIEKARVDKHFAERFENALMHGSTVEYRELFADFGCYWSKMSEEIPYYPHHDAVNGIDTAMFHIRIGYEQQAIDDYNFQHNRVDS